MKCIRCESKTSVIDVRELEQGDKSFLRRRRQCEDGHRFTTYETIYKPVIRQEKLVFGSIEELSVLVTEVIKRMKLEMSSKN